MIAVNALVNKKGGYIIIHSPHDHLVGKFDQQVDDSLKRLIPDQSSYHSYFSRYITDDGKHVVYRVKPKSGRRPLSILKYHTMVSLNCCVLEPTQGEFQNLLTEASLTADEEEESDEDDSDEDDSDEDDSDEDDSDEDDSDDEDDDSDGEDDSEHEEDDRMEGFMTNLVKGKRIMFGSVPFQEDIRTQAKCPENAKKSDTNGIQGLLTKLWNNFKITHYISAFSKVRYGGSIYVGVKEKSKGFFWCEGCELSDDDKNLLERKILSKIEKTTLCVGTAMPQQLVSVRFHPVKNSAEDTEAEGGERGGKQRYVVQIKVRRYKHGLIFHAPGQNLDTDGQGPELYTHSKHSMKPERVTPEDWLKHSNDLQSMKVYRVKPGSERLAESGM